MRARLLILSILTVAALPVSAAERNAEADVVPGAAALASADALRVTPPADPILTGAEGAADASGTSGILQGALYGGLAGAVIGAGVGLIEGGNYGRDIGIGAGAGILIGAALGATHAFGDARPLPASDGLGSTDRDPVLSGPRYVALSGRF